MMRSEAILDSKDIVYMIDLKDDNKIPSSNTDIQKYYYKILYWITRNQFIFLILLILPGFLALSVGMLRSYDIESSKEDIIFSIQEALDQRLHPLPIYNKFVSEEKFEYMPPDTYIDWTHSNFTGIRAGFVVITREEEVFRLRSTIMDVEERFNHRYGYPWIIISDKPLSSRFREWTASSTNGPTYFGIAPVVEWNEPYWVDIKLAEKKAKEKMIQDVEHGESMSWRRMTRYSMGFLAHHPLLRDLEFYWKIQPGSQYSCDILEDPFKKMKENKKKLSFALTMTENHLTLINFERIMKLFISKNKNIIQPIEESIYPALLNDDIGYREFDQNLQMALGDYTGKLSNCVIWNNFMIVSLDFLRSKEYKLLFDTLDASGGFFYERWGDTFPQTMAAALFLKKKEILFSDITGYSYSYGSICPRDLNAYQELKCTCRPFTRKVLNAEACLPKFLFYLNS